MYLIEDNDERTVGQLPEIDVVTGDVHRYKALLIDLKDDRVVFGRFEKAAAIALHQERLLLISTLHGHRNSSWPTVLLLVAHSNPQTVTSQIVSERTNTLSIDMSQSIQPSLALDRSTGYLRRHTTSAQWCSSGRDAVVRCSASRRAVLFGSALVGWSLTEATSPAFAAKLPKGFTIIQDKADGYQYLAPFGWQEVDVEGVDSLYKVDIHSPNAVPP